MPARVDVVLIPVGDRLLTPEQIRRTHQWRQLTKRMCVPGSICYLCGQPIEFGLRRNHPRGPSLDHVIALENGGDPFNPEGLAVAHFGCNSAKGARVRKVEQTWSDW